jgi:hypothetical protein
MVAGISAIGVNVGDSLGSDSFQAGSGTSRPDLEVTLSLAPVRLRGRAFLIALRLEKVKI